MAFILGQDTEFAIVLIVDGRQRMQSGVAS